MILIDANDTRDPTDIMISVFQDHIYKFKVSENAPNRLELYNVLLSLQYVVPKILPLNKEINESVDTCSSIEELDEAYATEPVRSLYAEFLPLFELFSPLHSALKKAFEDGYITYSMNDNQAKTSVILRAKL